MSSRALPDLVSRLRLLFDDKEPSQAADRVTARIEGMGQRVQKALVPIGATLTGVGAGLTALSQPAQRAERVLTQAVNNTGQSYDKFAAQVDRTIAAQVRFGNNSAEVRTALTNLTIKLHDPQKALDNLGLATDIAALKQISLAEASNLVAGALNGNGRVFKQFGIVLDASKPKAEAVAEAMEKLRATVNGFAEGEAKALPGRLESIRTKLENIGAEIGERAGPAIAGFGAALTTVGGAADGVESVSNILDKLPGKTEGVARAFGGLGLAAGGAFVAVKALNALNDALDTARRGSKDLGEVAAGLVKVTKGAEDLDELLKSARIGGGIESLLDDLKKARADMSIFSRAASNDFKKTVDDLDEALAALVDNGKAPAAAAAFKLLNDTLQLTPKEQAKYFNEYANAVEASGNQAVIASAKTDTHSTALNHNAEAMKGVAEALERQLQAQLASISSTLGMESAADRVSDAQTDVAEKTKAATDAIAKHKAGSEEAKVAAEALSDAERGLKDAAVGAAGAAVRLAQDQAAANGQAFTAAQANEIFRGKLIELANQIGGPTGEALRALAQQIVDIPGSKEILVTANTTQAEAALARVIAAAQQMQRETHFERYVDPSVPGRATGGPVTKHRPYWVGEKGIPELFIPDVSGRIVPRDDLVRSGSGSTATAVAERPVLDEAALARAIARGFEQVSVNMDSRSVGQATRSRRRAMS